MKDLLKTIKKLETSICCVAKDVAAAIPGGEDTYIQFNDAGVFGGDANLTYNKTTGALSSVSFQGDGSALTGRLRFKKKITYYFLKVKTR